MKLSAIAGSAALAAGALASSDSVFHSDYQPYSKELSSDAFFEQFDGDWNARWKESHARKDDEFTYVGKWNVEEPTVHPGFRNDKGLVVKSPAAHHAISAKLPQVFDNKDNTLVLQYEVKLQKGLTCGGAYVKLLDAKSLDNNKQFSNETPYQVMFGPDKCGSTNKVHFIIKRKNPITGQIEEKHLSTPPMGRAVKTSSLYTLIIKPNQDFEIRINGDVAKAGNLLDEKILKPSLNPPTEVDDEKDVKPKEWIDEEYIPDPEQSVKPEDWDEDAPFRIPDPEATKPADWDEEASEYIIDPEASKPEDWDDEEDGEWLAPEIRNPNCLKHGCGKWEAPLIPNPDYKGKWEQPLIPNPAYKGEWTPRKIPNPDYYEDSTPSDLEPIGGLGFELWTMDNDILFDNIYLGHDIIEAEEIGNNTFLPKLEIELEDQALNAPKPKIDAEEPPSFDNFFDENDSTVSRYLNFLKTLVFAKYIEAQEFAAEFISNPVEVLSTKPVDFVYYAGLFVAIFTVVLGFWSTLLFTITGGSGAKNYEQSQKAGTKSSDSKTEAKIEEIVDEDATGIEVNESKATKRN